MTCFEADLRVTSCTFQLFHKQSVFLFHIVPRTSVAQVRQLESGRDQLMQEQKQLKEMQRALKRETRESEAKRLERLEHSVALPRVRPEPRPWRF